MKTDTAPAQPTEIFLKDYQRPPYSIEHVDLCFELSPEKTRVTAKLSISRHEETPLATALELDGEDLELLSVRIDGRSLDSSDYTQTDTQLIIPNVPDNFTLETVCHTRPEANTALSGLYMSNGMFCTQCEAEGFRRITFYPDRPDVLATFDVRIEAEKSRYPVLLSNGNDVTAGNLERDGWHYACWSDPHPKPAYLFALVGGDLAFVEDKFTTQSGRDVTLRVFVQPENIEKCDYTLDSLKRSMKWDEEKFGREYDLDIFMIVAVDHFNFGAMENKGLNIFNSAYVLASPSTATDMDYELIEGIVAHEYFHNWSGNRVTCRDWFQLCLKEGFTVFRDQEFSADARSRPVQRIKDVRRLWQTQFPEDAGPLAHPARPESYITIDNFYTATVYNKGAELVRMMKTLIDADKFRVATDLYFERHDGEAATVEDFIICMEEASGRDLQQFRIWYSSAGTPSIHVTDHFEGGIYSITLTQETAPTPGQPEKPARHMPVDLSLINAEGACAHRSVLELTQAQQTFTVEDLPSKPTPSVFCNFSAPVRVEQDLRVEERLHLLKHDVDPFNRWAIAQNLSMDIIRSFAGENKLTDAAEALSQYAAALSALVADETLEPAYRAELLKSPSASDISRAVEVIDPDAILAARKQFRTSLHDELQDTLTALYHGMLSDAAYSPDATQAGQRALKNSALGMLMASGSDAAFALAAHQAQSATNMTDEAAAVLLITTSERPERSTTINSFYEKWQHETLVINKWLAWQAMADHSAALADIKTLTQHEAFDLKNPNKVRSLIGAFANENLGTFHKQDGTGYAFFFEMIKSLDPINPQVAARLLTATENWRALEANRSSQLADHLSDLAKTTGLSKNLFEMAQRLSG